MTGQTAVPRLIVTGPTTPRACCLTDKTLEVSLQFDGRLSVVWLNLDCKVTIQPLLYLLAFTHSLYPITNRNHCLPGNTSCYISLSWVALSLFLSLSIYSSTGVYTTALTRARDSMAYAPTRRIPSILVRDTSADLRY